MKEMRNSLIKDVFTLTCCVALLSSVVICEPIRHKRQTTQNYVIDTLVVVDDVVFTRFKEWFSNTLSSQVSEQTLTQQATTKLREYVALVLHQANDRLATLKQHLPYTVSLQPVDVRINENVLSDPVDLVNSGAALDAFRRWVESKGLGAQYDHAVLMTGHSLVGVFENSNLIAAQGRAYVGTICNQTGYSTSVVEDIGGFQSVFYVAHEVAHSLGSRHDGESSVNSCNPADNYIMAATRANRTEENKDHPWYFSTCSAHAIDSVVNSITSSGLITNVISATPNCLSTTSTPIAEFTYTADILAGQNFTASDQCQMIYGKESRVCLGSTFGSLGDICTSMYCQDPTATTALPTCARHYAAEGTSCGDKKWCRMGQCIQSEDAPVIGECPNGDSALLVNGLSCSDFVKRYPSECYNEEVRNPCCASCEAIRKVSQVCPYGDKVVGCQPERCNSIYPSGFNYNDQCCGTCGHDVVGLCADVSMIDGVTCDVKVEMQDTQNCYNTTVAYHCCATCANLRRNVRDCEYGDKLVGNYCLSAKGQDKEQFCADPNWKSTCCASCDPTPDSENTAVRLGWTSLPVSILVFLWICFVNNV